MDTFFLGVIAFSMLVVAVMAVVRTVLWALILLKLRKLINTVYLDYNKIYSPKLSILMDNFSSIMGILKILKLFKRGKT